MSKLIKHAYIHIPFCIKKCNYCSFFSINKIQKKKLYLKELQKEILSNYKKEKLKTLYIGGGTPSLLTKEEINNFIKLFNFSKNNEITFEANPNNLSHKYLEMLAQTKINRLSIGIQTFNDKILNYIERLHSSKHAINAVLSAKKIGFNNINIDLIYGLPFQTKKIFLSDLKKAVSLDIQHISLYGLKIDKNCFFYKNKPQNLPDNDFQADMYEIAVEFLIQNGFNHYEISNFAKKKFYSKHNLSYWNCENYYGFGASACGYLNNIRYQNHSDLEKYLPLENKIKTKEILDFNKKLSEEIFLGLRKTKGIDITKINEKFNIDFNQKYFEVIKKYLNSKHLIQTKKGYKLSLNGILQSNYILSDFL